MARLSTHVLDTSHGRPAAGMRIRLYTEGGIVREATTNRDGRTDAPLLSGDTIPTGVFDLVFCVGEYYGAQGTPFLGEVVVRFGIEDPSADYHVPLLVSPYGYTTYRGS
jgi:5-hydroxyisourate hydrolase